MNDAILVVDDDARSLRAMRGCLEAAGYRVTATETGEQALRLAALRPFAAILLDLGLPDIDGHALCARLRTFSSTAIVVVTVVTDLEAKVEILDAGADSFLTKPFLPAELLATVRAAIRRNPLPSPGVSRVEADDVTVDLQAREVTRGGKPVHLTPHEFGVLATLARNHDRPVTHGDLLAQVWGPSYRPETNYLWVCMRQLRKKLEREPSRPQLLITEHRVGYRLRTKRREVTPC